MKIMTVVGARPQFVKMAMLSKEIRNKHDEIIVHTGQHFDYDMSDKFFEELNIPRPKYNLGISGGTHAEMTARMMVGIEEVIINEKPDLVLLYGDTNSTIAAALVAAKLHIPICHVEAGVRTHNKDNPEEVNRICTDHLSSILFTCTEESKEALHSEGIIKNVFCVGDLMYDAFLFYSNKIPIDKLILRDMFSSKKLKPYCEEYYYLTCHREENTKDDFTLISILEAMEALDKKVIYPVHPRNKERIGRICQDNKYSNTFFCNPVGYLESLCLVNNCKGVITDSGGLQREAFFAQKKCITLLDFVVWPEIMVGNRNNLSRPIKEDILLNLYVPQDVDSSYLPFGDGHAASKIIELL